MSKKCKHCGTEIGFYDWIFWRTCGFCSEEIERQEEEKERPIKEKQERDSKRYWSKQKK